MKIALMHYSTPPIVGGVESVIANHARMMANSGHDVSIISGRGEQFDTRIPVHILPLLNSKHPDVLRVKGQLDRGKYTPEFDIICDLIFKELITSLTDIEILIVHNICSLHKNLPLTAALYRAYKQIDFPRLILWHHDLAWTSSNYKKELHEGYPWELIKNPWNGVKQVTISEQRRQELTTLLNIPSDSITVIPNGVDFFTFYKAEDLTISFIEKLSLQEADPLLLLPVRLTPRKNIELALYMMAELNKLFPKVQLIVTGPVGPHNPANNAYKQKLLNLRKDLFLENSVHFLAELNPGFIPDNVIADLFHYSDGLFFPSHEEGFGIPLIEAAFSKIPVFCANIPVLRELGGDDVSYFDPNANPFTISTQVAERFKTEKTSRWARRAKKEFSWDRIYYQNIEPLLDEVSK